jgi:hypothetical protein
MASFKSLLLRVEVRPAGKKSRCSHNKKHEILKGEPRVVVKAPGVATPEKGYCADCGREMIEKAQEALRQVERDLESRPE